MIRNVRVEIIAIAIVFGPTLLLVRLTPMTISWAGIAFMATVYISLRASQVLRTRYHAKNKEIENEQRARRDLY